jgi:hypothetical protein
MEYARDRKLVRRQRDAAIATVGSTLIPAPRRSFSM